MSHNPWEPKFKDCVDFMTLFTAKDLIDKNVEQFKQALIDLNSVKGKMNLSDNECLLKIINESHRISLISSIDTCLEFIMDYHTWLSGNYVLTPKDDL